MGSRHSSLGAGMEFQRPATPQPGLHAAGHSFASNLSGGSGLDEALMREIDQVPHPTPPSNPEPCLRLIDCILAPHGVSSSYKQGLALERAHPKHKWGGWEG